jgi:hypothetical protein
VGAGRIGERSRHRRERRLVEDDVDVFDRLTARAGIADVTCQEAKACSLCGRHARQGQLDILEAAGREVVEPRDGLIEAEQGFEQMRPNEACYARDEPLPRPGA